MASAEDTGKRPADMAGSGSTLVKRQRVTHPKPIVKLLVAGGPGNGKSTVLNEIADGTLFDVGSGGMSCTQVGGEWERKNKKNITMSDGKKEYTFELQDTAGFPDTDATKAARYYDDVVSKCNGSINGVIFVIKSERLCADTLERYAILLREFVNLNVPLIIILNGTEPPKRRRETDAEYTKRRDTGIKNFYNIARAVEKSAELHAREILVSYTLEDLHDLKNDVARIFGESLPKESAMNTFEQVKTNLKAAADVEVAVQQKLARENQTIRTCQENIDSLQEEIARWAAWKGVRWIPFVGTVAEAYIEKVIEDKTQRVLELRESMGDAEGAKNAEQDLEKIKRDVARSQKQFDDLCKYLAPIVASVFT